MRLLSVLLIALVAVSATSSAGEVEIELHTEMNVAPAATLTTFTAKPGSPLPDFTIILLDGKPVARAEKVFGGVLTKADSEVSISFNTLSPSMLKLLRKYIKGRGGPLKPNFSFIVKGGPKTVDRIDLSDVQLLSFELPALGKADSWFTIKLHYRGTKTTKNVKMQSLMDHPVRSEFFKLTFKDPAVKEPKPAPTPKGKDKKKNTKASKSKGPKVTIGQKLSKQHVSVGALEVSRAHGAAPILAIRDIDLSVVPNADKQSIDAWKKWSDKDRNVEREASLVYYHWTGERFDHSPEGRGQLKPLFTLNLSGVTVRNFEAGSGKVTLGVKSVVLA